MVLGIVTIYFLPDWPRDAKWLEAEAREWITRELAREKEAKLQVRHVSIGEALRMPRVILLTLIYFLSVTGIYGFAVWFP